MDIPKRKTRQIDFPQELSPVVYKVEQVTVQRTSNYPIKGKLKVSVLGTTSSDYAFTYDSVFENLDLILSDFFLKKKVNNFCTCCSSFNYFHTMVNHVKPEIMHKLSQCSTDAHGL